MLLNPFARIGLSFAVTLFVLNYCPDFTTAAFITAAVCFALCLLVRQLPGRDGSAVVFLSAVMATLLFAGTQGVYWAPACALDGQAVAVSGEATGEIAPCGEYGYLSVLRTDSGERVQFCTKEKPDLQPGDKVSFYGKLSADNAWTNRAERVFLCCWYPKNISVQKTQTVRLVDAPKYMRQFLFERISDLVGEENGAVAAAMITGDKSLVTQDIRRAFSVSGISHTIAVSGLHMNLLVMLLYRLLSRIFRTQRRACAAVCMVVAWFYAAVADFTPSAVRACVMTCVFLGGIVFYRKANSYNSLGLAAFVILLCNPYAVCDLSFELSFSATLGLIWFGEKFSAFEPFARVKPKLVQKALTAVYRSVMITLCATISCMPVYAWQDFDVTCACFFTNAAIFFAVPSVLITGLSAVLPGAVGRVSAALCRICTKYILLVVDCVGKAEWISLFSAQAALIASVVFSVGALIWFYRKKVPKENRKLLKILSLLRQRNQHKLK